MGRLNSRQIDRHLDDSFVEVIPRHTDRRNRNRDETEKGSSKPKVISMTTTTSDIDRAQMGARGHFQAKILQQHKQGNAMAINDGNKRIETSGSATVRSEPRVTLPSDNRRNDMNPIQARHQVRDRIEFLLQHFLGMTEAEASANSFSIKEVIRRAIGTSQEPANQQSVQEWHRYAMLSLELAGEYLDNGTNNCQMPGLVERFIELRNQHELNRNAMIVLATPKPSEVTTNVSVGIIGDSPDNVLMKNIRQGDPKDFNLPPAPLSQVTQAIGGVELQSVRNAHDKAAEVSRNPSSINPQGEVNMSLNTTAATNASEDQAALDAANRVTQSAAAAAQHTAEAINEGVTAAAAAAATMAQGTTKMAGAMADAVKRAKRNRFLKRAAITTLVIGGTAAVGYGIYRYVRSGGSVDDAVIAAGEAVESAAERVTSLVG